MTLAAPIVAPGRLPPGLRGYAIGDIHGCADQLRALHRAVLADLADRPVPRAELVHLGDLLDRGPDSAGVIRALLAVQETAPPALMTITLRGNHEQMALDALTGDEVGLWLDNGGAATLSSWGVAPRLRPAAWAGLVPPLHLAFLRALPLRHRAGDYLFVHAGVRPGVPLGAQTADDLLWIREPFLSATEPFGAVVVHGHTPTPAPVVRANRVGLDTGAVMGGALTCGVFEADRLGFLAA